MGRNIWTLGLQQPFFYLSREQISYYLAPYGQYRAAANATKTELDLIGKQFSIIYKGTLKGKKGQEYTTHLTILDLGKYNKKTGVLTLLKAESRTLDQKSNKFKALVKKVNLDKVQKIIDADGKPIQDFDIFLQNMEL